MKNTIRRPYRGHVIRTVANLGEHQLDQLVASLHADAGPPRKVLGGRCRMPGVWLDDVGRVVVKCYHRGGLIARFNHRHYIRGRTTRGEKEFEWLRRVRKLGVRAPEPIAAAHRGGLFYRCWLLTREVAGAVSLAQLSIDCPESLDEPLKRCRRQVDILVAEGILHPDLHPGNVLVDTDGQTWLIDFDKARYFHGRSPRLAARYRRRWLAAVRKHGLPSRLADALPPDSKGFTA